MLRCTGKAEICKREEQVCFLTMSSSFLLNKINKQINRIACACSSCSLFKKGRRRTAHLKHSREKQALGESILSELIFCDKILCDFSCKTGIKLGLQPSLANHCKLGSHKISIFTLCLLVIPSSYRSIHCHAKLIPEIQDFLAVQGGLVHPEYPEDKKSCT